MFSQHIATLPGDKLQTASPKPMNFRKSSKRPLTPPSFSENHIADFATKLRQKCVCSLWRDCCVLYDPISHEMHVVQQFNMVIGWKHTLKPPFCIIFMLKKAYLKVQNLQYKFLDWKWPPPFGTFPKIHPLWRRRLSLSFASLFHDKWGILHPHELIVLTSDKKRWPKLPQLGGL